MADSKDTEKPQTQGEEEEIDIDLKDPEVAAASSKIQAAFRARKGPKKPAVDQPKADLKTVNEAT